MLLLKREQLKGFCTSDKITCCLMTILILAAIAGALVMILNATPPPPLPAWGYECQQNKCVKVEIVENNISTTVSLAVCRIFCGDSIGTVWPKPSGPVKLGPYMVHINRANIDFRRPAARAIEKAWPEIENRFLEQIKAKTANAAAVKSGGKQLVVKYFVTESNNYNLESYTDESYNLSLTQGNGEVFAEIKSVTIFGARHGLETLSQLIVYDDIRRELQLVGEGNITDAPAYSHRGLLLDTARNYFSIKSIKRTIDAMAMVKLNVFHWHITDSHSFPLVLKSHPDLAKYGAYSNDKVYTAANIADVVSYARARGVRVLPEYDAPAHVGEGWQHKDMTACFNKQPWNQFCVEPPCGQLDPTVDKMYDVLEDIYREMYQYFDSPGLFHMGGDEVSVSCWNSSERIQKWMLAKGWELQEKDFLKLWGHFQDNALERFDKVTGLKLPVILWTSRLTDEPYINEYLDKRRYIIQVWTTGTDTKINELLKLGFKLILSNYDALYFDCGFGGWVTDGNNWCSPYIGWQKVYMNKPGVIGGEYKDQILGSEAALWTEQVDEYSLDARFWPRASALAERLWSDPEDGWMDVESRLLVHRERLVENGISAESLQPQWCVQNEGECPIVQNGA